MKKYGLHFHLIALLVLIGGCLGSSQIRPDTPLSERKVDAVETVVALIREEQLGRKPRVNLQKEKICLDRRLRFPGEISSDLDGELPLPIRRQIEDLVFNKKKVSDWPTDLVEKVNLDNNGKPSAKLYVSDPLTVNDQEGVYILYTCDGGSDSETGVIELTQENEFKSHSVILTYSEIKRQR